MVIGQMVAWGGGLEMQGIMSARSLGGRGAAQVDQVEMDAGAIGSRDLD